MFRILSGEHDKNKGGEFNKSQELSLQYMKILVDTARESFLILDPKLRVVSANPTFYKVFKVSQKETEGQVISSLGNGQWDIPALRKLLEAVLPKEKNVKNYEVSHVFETIGEKTILLNARQIDSIQLIILAMEDITERKRMEEKLADYTKKLEAKTAEETTELAIRVKELEVLNESMVGRELKMVELKKEIKELKEKLKNSNGSHRNG